MSETDKLRELLDERWVEWTSGNTEVSRNIRTDFCPDAGVSVSVWENDGKLGIDVHTLYRFTPEQAIAATLGAGTCKLTQASWDNGTCTWGCICSACDAHLEHETGIGYNFCPICGAKVVDE